MAFRDWTFSGNDTGTLDAGMKYSGSSSYKSYMDCPDHTSKTTYLRHNTFSEPRAQIVVWCRAHRSADIYVDCKMYVEHESYGPKECVLSGYDVWEKHRVTFWHDVVSNTKFGRDERWTGSAWVETGTDSNFGEGSPSPGSITLRGYGKALANSHKYLTHWFDEVEVYS